MGRGKNNSSKGATTTRVTKPGAKPRTRLSRVINTSRKLDQDARKQAAGERLSRALKRIEDAKPRKQDNIARKADLERRLAEQPAAEQETTKTELEALDQEMSGVDAEIERAKEEETNARKELEDIEMEDLSEEPQAHDPDNPIRTTEGSDLSGPPEARNRSADEDTDEEEEGDEEEEEENAYPDLISHDEIRRGLGLTGGECLGWTKAGPYGKRAVVQLGPKSSPAFRTMKARQFDGIIDHSSKFNIVKHRRCDVRNKDDTKKFTLDDVVGIKGVSYYVEDGHEGNPAEKLKPLPPKLTKKQKEAMELRGEKVVEEPRPKPEPVHVIIQWKQQYRGRWRSLETREGVRALYGSANNGDKAIYKAALAQEKRYQEHLGGQRPANSQSPTPFAPGDENTPAPEGERGEATIVTPPGGTQPEARPAGGQTSSSRAAKQAAMDEFKDDYLLAAGQNEWKDLTPQQQSDGVEAFRLFWGKKQVAV
ncbi:hypothetical protein DL95DRAFT_472384 [Leptodontidium sp. 2 PMI_412]|nr:hypothetical protein BKA61DRAFT_581553 [Leptodontidium sp. MPI-SDFR-AT-0119]KAH9203439.1 hypothetical protein DL95DRAFT_472384 [Leptodontidium sp. 2 PMI_412]